MTSAADFVDLKGNVSGRTTCPLGLVVIALIFSEIRGGAKSAPPPPTPGPRRPK